MDNLLNNINIKALVRFTLLEENVK